MVCFDCSKTVETDSRNDADEQADLHMMGGCNDVTVFNE